MARQLFLEAERDLTSLGDSLSGMWALDPWRNSYEHVKQRFYVSMRETFYYLEDKSVLNRIAEEIQHSSADSNLSETISAQSLLFECKLLYRNQLRHNRFEKLSIA